ncbi:MAG: hypothetical protein HFI96_15900, partial [Lachnospiraceae bacterium]|nr:hypothetical protein [Lachnospiraceae bacterium]
VSSDTWLKCRKKLMANTTFQNGRKARNTWLAGKVKCGKCGYALKVTRNPSGYEYLRCNKRSDHKGCPAIWTNDWSTKQGVWHGYCRHVLRQRTLRH